MKRWWDWDRKEPYMEIHGGLNSGCTTFKGYIKRLCHNFGRSQRYSSVFGVWSTLFTRKEYLAQDARRLGG